MKNAFGYLLGFLVFVAGIPAIMWWVSGRPFPWAPMWLKAVPALILMVIGLGLSIGGNQLCIVLFGEGDTKELIYKILVAIPVTAWNYLGRNFLVRTKKEPEPASADSGKEDETNV